MVSRTIVTALVRLQQGIKHRQLIVVLPKSNLLLDILRKFYERHLISGFKVYGREVDVVLRYRDVSCAIKNLSFVYMRKKKSKKSGKGKASFCTLICYLTSYGGTIFEPTFCSKHGAGGLLFLVVEI